MLPINISPAVEPTATSSDDHDDDVVRFEVAWPSSRTPGIADSVSTLSASPSYVEPEDEEENVGPAAVTAAMAVNVDGGIDVVGTRAAVDTRGADNTRVECDTRSEASSPITPEVDTWVDSHSLIASVADTRVAADTRAAVDARTVVDVRVVESSPVTSVADTGAKTPLPIAPAADPLAE